jgi:hypothetical protein
MTIEPPPPYSRIKLDNSRISLEVIKEEDWYHRAFTHGGRVYYVDPFLGYTIWAWAEGGLHTMMTLPFEDEVITAADIWLKSSNAMPIYEFLQSVLC